MGEHWVAHSLSYLHNSLMPAGTAPELLYDNGTNHTSTMSRRETTAYTALLPAGSDNEAVVIYGLLRYLLPGLECVYITIATIFT